MAESAARATVRDAPERGFVRGLRFVARNRMWTPRYWLYALRYLWTFKVRRRHVVTRGFVFLERGVEIRCTRGLGRMELGRWVWIGRGSGLRCHEGSLRVGDKTVLGERCAVNAYLDVDVGPECLFADDVHVTDFDHRFEDPTTAIRKQGIVRTRVRIEADCWLGAKAVVLRGSVVERGSVVGAGAVVRGRVPAYSIAVGIPARIVGRRGQ